MSEEELFRKFLVLDYVVVEGKKQYYVCPARKNDLPAAIVEQDWTFSDRPCTFLHDGKCSIQPVKPKGGRTYYCRLLKGTDHDTATYGKKRAAQDWARNPRLQRLLTISSDRNQKQPPHRVKLPARKRIESERNENIYSPKTQLNYEIYMKEVAQLIG
jgi:Fe-S-cluster containining protein